MLLGLDPVEDQTMWVEIRDNPPRSEADYPSALEADMVDKINLERTLLKRSDVLFYEQLAACLAKVCNIKGFDTQVFAMAF